MQRLTELLAAVRAAAPAKASDIAALEGRVQALRASDRTEMLLHPLYGLWSLHLARCLRQGRGAEAQAWVAHLNRFLVVPSLAAPGTSGWRARVLVSRGELRFPGTPHHLPLAAMEAEIEVEDRHLTVRANGDVWRLPASALLSGGGGFVSRPAIDGIEIDASDPWIGRFLAGLRHAAAEPGYPQRDARPHDPVAQAQYAIVVRSLDILRQSWPEMHAEVIQHVRLFVPFESALLVGWTHASLPGAVFIRAAPEDMLFTLERLVHEASHVRLYLMAAHPMFATDRNRLLPSPFRKDPRPVAGVYHAAFVYGRLIEFARRAHRHSGEPRLAARALELLPLYRQAVTALRGSAALTCLGATLLDELDGRLEATA
jgi:HEXXH motif-containing protein